MAFLGQYMATYGQLRSLSAGGPPGGPPWWKTSSWKTNIKNFKLKAPLGQLLPLMAKVGHSLPEDLPEDPLGGRQPAGRPILKIFNKKTGMASNCHLRPSSVTFCRRTSWRTPLLEDKLLEDSTLNSCGAKPPKHIQISQGGGKADP